MVDVVEVLTDSVNPTDYLKKLRKRDPELGSYVGTNCPQIEMFTSTGKKRRTRLLPARNQELEPPEPAILDVFQSNDMTSRVIEITAE